MIIPLDKIKKELVGSKIQKPLNSTLSGHSAGEPFDKYVYRILKAIHPDKVFRQFEYLNKLFLEHPEAKTFDERNNLFPSEAARLLLARGKETTINWKIDNQFEEKQNDTADILIVSDKEISIIDVKTRNKSKSAQAPNIISAFKLANLSKLLIKSNNPIEISIHYIGIDWRLDQEFLICEEVHYANLFKEKPTNLYINWASAMQVQFHVALLKNEFDGTSSEWADSYLNVFVSQAKKRSVDMIEKFVKPFI